MSGSYFHCGGSGTNFTSLPTVCTTGILDSIISDLSGAVASGTNNGWTLYDDLRATTGTTDAWIGTNPLVMIANGILNQVTDANNNWYTATSGSANAICNNNNGYNWAYAISGVSGSGTQISWDRVNWYKAYYSAWATYVTATLDRPFAQATQGTRYLYQRGLQWAVLKCTSQNSQRNFYLLIGCTPERGGGPTLYMQVWENWDTTLHQGYGNSSDMEATIIWWAGVVNPALMKARYILWLLPDVFALWTAPATGATWNGPGLMSFTYIGNLDTTNIRSNDVDATVFIPGQTTYSGRNCGGAGGQGTTSVPGSGGGAITCFRTVGGYPWGNIGYGSLYMENQYQVYPRSRPYAFDSLVPNFDVNGTFVYTEADIIHTPANTVTSNAYIVNLGSDGIRGKLRYLKLPVSNPSFMFMTTVSGSDGNYILLRQGPTMYSTNQTTAPAVFGVENFNVGGVGAGRNYMTGWAWSFSAVAAAAATFGDVTNVAGNGGGYYNYIMMPI